MSKKVFYDDDARRRVLAGAKILYDAVRMTLGPKGRNVVIGKSYGNPTVTHDGVTVAKGVELEDVDDETLGYKVGAELIKQAASKMNDMAGDGTTTVTVLTYHILYEANKLIAAGHNPMQLRKGLEAAGQQVIAKLDSLAEDIQGKKSRVAEVATISAGDPEIGDKIADVMDKIGKDGVVTVEEGQGLALESEIVEGFTFDRGFVSAYMVTDTTRMEAVYNKPAIIVTDKKISSIQEIAPILDKVTQAGKKELVIIAEDVDGDALTMLVINRLKGALNSVAVKAPSFGDRRKDILSDIAILTGATVISEEQGFNFENAELAMVGSARKVIVTKDETTIIEGAGTAAAVQSRIKEINAQIQATTSDYDKKELEKRRASLNGKVAVIKVGGATETEIEEKKYRVDDAVAAVKAALDEGIVPGGGVTLINLGTLLVDDLLKNLKTESGKRMTPTEVAASYPAEQILVNALTQPFVQLIANAGEEPAVFLGKIFEAKKLGLGYDVNDLRGEPIDVMKKGIVDPARVTKEAILNAVSIAGTAMTMGALVVEVPKEEKASPSPDMGGMGMM